MEQAEYEQRQADHIRYLTWLLWFIGACIIFVLAFGVFALLVLA